MEKKKILIFVAVVVPFIFVIQTLDVQLKYKLGLEDYYKYNVTLNREEKEFIKEKSFIVGVYNSPPLIFSNEFNNQNSGIMVDYISQIAIESGNDWLIRVGSKEEQLDSLHAKDVDIIVVSKNCVSDNSIEITQSLCTINTRILVPSDENTLEVSILNNKTLITLKRDMNSTYIQEYLKNKNITVVPVDNMYQAFALLEKNFADGLLGNDMEITHFLKVTNRTSQFKFLKGNVQKNEICLAVLKNNTSLLNILNKGILGIKKKNLILQTQKKWLGDYESDNVDVKFIDVIYKIVLAIFLIVAGLTAWNYVITKRVNIKTKELSESKGELRLIIDTMKNGLMVIDNQSIILECNDAIERYTGISREDLLGKYSYDFEDLKFFLDDNNINSIFKFKNSYYYVSLQKLTTNKKMIIIDDYTEQYFAEKKARQEAKMVAVGQLSAGLAHEIRNPLGLIKSYSYIIEKQALNTISTHAIAVIYDSVHRINNLIENLLKFSKLSNDERKTIVLSDFVGKIIELEYGNVSEKGIVISTSIIDENCDKITINQEVLRMILINLVGNGIDSFKNVMRNDKAIDISIWVRDTSLRIKVKDNGMGMESEQLEHIFDPFYSTKESGTGLGLYIISTEIYNNDGKISVDSVLGKGTEFDIELPIERIKND